MKRLVIDIETVGLPWEDLDPYVREYLIKGLSDGDAEEAKRSGGLSPFRGRIIAIGVINIDDGRSCALYEVPGQVDMRVEKAGLRTYISGTEKQILEKFWDWFESDSRFITFNGRQFDGPFLMIRSAIHGLTPKRDLVGQRYELHPNCDLREVLNFYGTPNPRQYKFNLDLACKAFGVETSKGEGLDGRSVETWYRAGRHREIAEYCMDDVRATAELYEKLAATLLPMNFRFREAEMRSARNAGQMALLPTSESTFIESIAQTSMTLAAALEREPAVVSGSHEAIVLEKLIRTDEAEEVPTELP